MEYESLFFWPSWFPQTDVPVLQSTYTVVGHDKIDYRTHAVGLIEPPVMEKASIRKWQLTHIKPRAKERSMPPEDRIQMRLFFAPVAFKIGKSPGSFASWDAMAKWYGVLANGRYDLPQVAVESTRVGI